VFLVPRKLCIGNGNLLAAYDGNLNIRDMYFPFVGMENHVGGHLCRIGVWADGRFSWIDDSWNKKIGYQEDSLVTETLLSKPNLQVELQMTDCVHHFHNILIRKVKIRNLSDKAKEIRTFFSHDFHMSETDEGITAYYHPDLDAVVHYKKNRYILTGGQTEDNGLYEFATGIIEFANLAGTWKDAEDGSLSNNLVAHGSVDSVISLRSVVPPNGEKEVFYWIAVGTGIEEVSMLADLVKQVGPNRLIRETGQYFEAWAAKSEINFGTLPSEVVSMFKRSLLILRTQIDNRGGIIASCDSDILRFNKDTYSYVWPRDGAFVSMGLDAAGYFHVTQRFFDFCSKIVAKDGFLYQKYHPDGSLGSTWHPWSSPSRKFQLPIQEDETALVIYSLWNHYYQARDIEFIGPIYEPLVCKAADFMVRYRDTETKLPLASYDLWEENRGISTFTCAAVFGGLKASSKLAKLFGDSNRAEKYDAAATEVKEAILKHLYDGGKGRFLKLLRPDEKGGLTRDSTVDSSVYGVFEFGVLPADDPRVESTMRAVEKTLTVKSKSGGVARYQNDYYQRVSQDVAQVPGNPWIICTLWLAEWYIAKSELDKGLTLLKWVVDHVSETGVLAEQIHPYNNEPLSVSPLTWSHSTFVLTVIEYLNKLNELKICDKCGLPLFRSKKGRLW
jgi:oligosaccharide amylase